jgi:hypothetical protein
LPNWYLKDKNKKINIKENFNPQSILLKDDRYEKKTEINPKIIVVINFING